MSIEVAAGMAAKNGISAQTQVVVGRYRIVRISVTTAGSAAGTINDTATVGGIAAGNLIASIPNTVGIYWIDWPCVNGICITPGTSQVLSITYSGRA